MTVHRFIPAHPFGRHGDKTACGIKVEADDFGDKAIALDGGVISVSRRGEPFDCSRCRRVLELRHNGALTP